MVKLTVEPPEYYPVVDKFFADGLVEALEALGIEVTDIKAGVKQVNNRLRIGFIIELTRPETFSLEEIETIVSTILDKLAGDATSKVGSFYGAAFEVAGFRVVESKRGRRERKSRVVINAPDDAKPSLERLGKGLAIYLKDRGIDFSALVINVPKDGRPKGVITLLLRKAAHPLEKERIGENIAEKARSYLRTLNMEYLSIDVRILDPDDKKVSTMLKEHEKTEKIADKIREDDGVREVLGAFGKRFPEL